VRLEASYHRYVVEVGRRPEVEREGIVGASPRIDEGERDVGVEYIVSPSPHYFLGGR